MGQSNKGQTTIRRHWLVSFPAPTSPWIMLTVIGIGDGPDRWSSTDLVEAFGEAHRRELRPRIGVGHESDQSLRAARQAGHLERVEDHVGLHVRRHPPADDAPGERVDDEAHIGHPERVGT